ncbi:STAS domain-containing protein [Erythrobacter sp. Alg231-14]|uniref:STAS domain-containing protein n=1 Tax=Erythrobacter sp. Alg231-14 TaxID=1922225 RepID=UPI00307C585D
MQHLIEMSPVLGAYDKSSKAVRLSRNSASNTAFGNPVNPRYARRMTGSVLDWKSDERAGATVLAPSGRVDESTADVFKEHLLAAMGKGPSLAVIDLAGVEYMSSRGLRALTLAQRAGKDAETTIILARPNDTMREILAISRYDMVFRVAETIEDAIGH